MGFPRSRPLAPAPPRVRVAVFAVGQRVHVACSGDRSGRATLTDDAGKTPLASLGDGTEVAILAWRPGPAGTTRYRVRATDDSGLEGWLPVGNLRSTEAAAAPPSPPELAPTSERSEASADPGRRFGQRAG